MRGVSRVVGPVRVVVKLPCQLNPEARAKKAIHQSTTWSCHQHDQEEIFFNRMNVDGGGGGQTKPQVDSAAKCCGIPNLDKLNRDPII